MPRGRPKKVTTEEKPIEKKVEKERYIFAVGRRKTAVARVLLYSEGDGSITVNGKPIKEYFSGIKAEVLYLEPFKITNTNPYRVVVKVEGSGKNGQLGAVIHGLARALEKLDKEKNRPILKKRGLLTRDARERERRKVGTGGRARRQKQSPKR